MSITGDADGDPMKVGVAIADITRGHLRDRRRARGAARGDARPAAAATSRSSLFDAQLAWLANRASDFLVAGETPERLGNAHPAIVPVRELPRARRPRDRRDRHRRTVRARSVARPSLDELLDDPRFAHEPRPRAQPRRAHAPCSRARSQRSPVAEWLELMERAGVPGRPRAHDPRGVRARAVRDARPRAREARADPHRPLADRARRRAPDGGRPTPAPRRARRGDPYRGRLSSQEVERLLASVCRSDH